MIVLFDLNGTLTDPAGIGEWWGAPDLGLVSLQGAVQTAMVDALLGLYRPFAEHLRAAIQLCVGRRGLDPDGVDAALRRAAHLDAFPEAAEALDHLREGGHRLVTLTNSGGQAGRETLEAAGLADRFERVLGVDAVRSFKPHPRTYAYALTELRARSDEVMMVAAHGWDVTGAKHAGLRTTWISRGEQILSGTALEPDHRADDLLSAARKLTA
ncbi:MAG: haloacid dehalogenase type II [Candidatus Dormibacteria bacterium]